ncbi:hypothetical protein, partial [Thiolapillus sp.]
MESETKAGSPQKSAEEPHFQQACLRPRDRFWDIPVPKIDSAFDNLYLCPSRPGHQALRNN